jgi:GAF domain-containing protein
MTEQKRFPAEILSLIEGDLAQLVHGYVRKHEVPRCLLAFIGEGHSIDIRPALKTDESWQVLYARADEGLIGHVLQTGASATWSGGDQPNYFKQGDPRTIFEIGAPIMHQGAPTGVLLIDYFEGELTSPNFPDWKLDQWCKEIERGLTATNKAKDEIEKSILHITGRCVNETESIGGYTALKRWDGTMMYVLAGKNAGRFRYFSQLEGICGEVLRRGVHQNVPYVWDHPRYRSSDDKVASEFVAPIIISDECIGVLNMEAVARDHYNTEREQQILYYAAELTVLAERYRKIVGSQIGAHGSLLSDLLEQLSAPVDEFFEWSSDNHIRAWAFDLLDRKVRRLDGVYDLSFTDFEGAGRSGSKQMIRKADEPPFEYEVTQRPDEYWECEFDMLDDAVTTSKLQVVFKNRPEESMLEIIDQFCRLTMNEVRRREEETRSVEFEWLMSDICNLSTEMMLATAPGRIKRIFNCDDVTYFAAKSLFENEKILVAWSSTSKLLGATTQENYYRIAPHEGFTGFAATKRDILLIRNAHDDQELRSIDPKLKWKGKIYEDTPGPVRSFFAIPLYVDSELIGIVRGHRNVKTKNVSFMEADRNRLRLVQFFLERAVERSFRAGEDGAREKKAVVVNALES